MKTYKPEHLKLWTLPDSYCGPHHPGYYVFLGQHRDSDIVTRCNFKIACETFEKQIEASDNEENERVMLIRDSHWAVGWIEYILIHQDCIDELKQADEMMKALDDYPVLSDDRLLEMESEQESEEWESYGRYEFKKFIIKNFPEFEEIVDLMDDEKLNGVFWSISSESHYNIYESDGGFNFDSFGGIKNKALEMIKTFLEENKGV